MQDLFPELGLPERADFASLAVEKPTLMIAMTARTGSTWLCAELERACKVGMVTEIFNPRGPIQHSGCWHEGETFAEYISCLTRTRAGDIFAFKTTWNDFAPIAPYALKLFPDLRVAFLRRHSIEAQALSHYYAMKTGQWHLRPADAKERKKPEHLDLAEIDRIIDHFERELRSWQSFFVASVLRPHEIYYEDFRHDITTAVSALARLGGMGFSEGPARSATLEKMGDDNDPWLLEVVRHRKKLAQHRGR